MDTESKEYRRLRLYMLIGAVLSFALVLIFAKVSNVITAKMIYGAVSEVKKTMLKENVENLISYLDVCADNISAQDPDISKAELEEAIRKTAHDKIYSEIHADGTYMWVQKVLDYEGGDGYAIRLIHPNLSDTEGELLSTNTINPDGTRAYEKELEGVKQNGAVYLTYDFKKLNSDEVTQKITYSALYERFDWIVCMGVNVDDLDHYKKNVLREMSIPQMIVVIAGGISWFVLLYAMFNIYGRTKGRLLERKNKELNDLLSWDTVSRANSRLHGQKLLEDALKMAKSGKKQPLVVMLDIDHFKQFNDDHGHELGDKVLSSFVETVRKNISENDAVIRWGGDEFIAILYDVPPEKQPETGDNILASLKQVELPELKKGAISASMGFTYMSASDTDINMVLERADEAVYEAKENGRACW
ncbi:MAG: diguanylate cyclase, partial [Lachnospiraceae bacterium]|nr:diguanylate cyclase [Lachnospiraceae bacterium]